jgi:hypothetical protein
VFFDLIHLARDLTGVCSAAIMQVPALIARRVDLNAGDSNQTEPVQGRDRRSPLVLVWLEGWKADEMAGRSPAVHRRQNPGLQGDYDQQCYRHDAGGCAVAGLNDEHRTEMTLDGVRIEGITRGQVHGRFATVTLGVAGQQYRLWRH